MAKKESQGVEPAKETGVEKRRRLRRESGQVAVYSECSITVCVDRAANEFLKFTVGHERFSPSDSDADLARTETAAWKFNEAVVDKRSRQIKRLIRQIAVERG